MRSILKIIFVITLIELFVGGGGRVLEVGPATLRILLFFGNIAIVTVLFLCKGSIPKQTIFIVSAVLGIFIFYVGLGLFNKADVALVIEDVKPLSYFFSIIFFSFYVNTEERVQLVVSLLKKTSLFMAIAYILIQLLFLIGKLDFIPFYNYINTHVSPSDFIFRGTNGIFFYKGFLYMVVGLIFWIHSNNSRLKALAILILVTAMILTGTRGFILMFMSVYALFYGIPLLLKLNIKVLVLASILILGSIYFFGNIELGDKDLSDSIRIKQLIEVGERINPISFFIGHGFGVGVPIREVHMEIGYLEVFHKQGVIGLSLWGMFFIILYNNYVRAKNYMAIRKSFLLSVVFVLLLSLTNPFFNNPIGISLFMIALSVLVVLNRLDANENIVKINAPTE